MPHPMTNPVPLRAPCSRRAFLRDALVALAAPQLLACDSSATGLEASATHLTARPARPGKEPVTGAPTPLGLDSPRDGLLYVPTSYATQARLPLLVALHGAGGSASDWQSYWARAEARGMIVLALDSRAGTWDRVFQGAGSDAAFMDEALRLTFRQCRVDPQRIALCGFSDGGAYALSLGVANGDLFTHLIAYSPAYFRPAEPIIGRPRIFVSHGTSDIIVPYGPVSTLTVPQLEAAGYDVTFVPFDGGHLVPAEISEAALTWFLGG